MRLIESLERLALLSGNPNATSTPAVFTVDGSTLIIDNAHNVQINEFDANTATDTPNVLWIYNKNQPNAPLSKFGDTNTPITTLIINNTTRDNIQNTKFN